MKSHGENMQYDLVYVKHSKAKKSTKFRERGKLSLWIQAQLFIDVPAGGRGEGWQDE